MPLKTCSAAGKDGYKWGDGGTCYTHDGSATGKKAARKKAIKQGLAIGGGKFKPGESPTTHSPTYAEHPWWLPARGTEKGG